MPAWLCTPQLHSAFCHHHCQSLACAWHDSLSMHNHTACCGLHVDVCFIEPPFSITHSSMLSRAMRMSCPRHPSSGTCAKHPLNGWQVMPRIWHKASMHVEVEHAVSILLQIQWRSWKHLSHQKPSTGLQQGQALQRGKGLTKAWHESTGTGICKDYAGRLRMRQSEAALTFQKSGQLCWIISA